MIDFWISFRTLLKERMHLNGHSFRWRVSIGAIEYGNIYTFFVLNTAIDDLQIEVSMLSNCIIIS